VIVTSKSVARSDPYFDPDQVADLTSERNFCSMNAPGHWICWDFGELRVRPTQYKIFGVQFESWVIEVSMDGTSWKEIDRKTNNQYLCQDRWEKASLTVSKPGACRFLRLTLTSKTHADNDYLILRTVEFFGTLRE
jgi:hypothetical protein